jgi:hypothetical protein
VYNQYAFGNASINSYINEGFDYLCNPKIFEVLFAPNNGLFLYSPILLLILSVSVFVFNNSKIVLVLPFLLIVIYVLFYSSWWSYYLGCGFGHRGFVDILPIYIVFLYQIMNSFKGKYSYIILLILCIYTTKLSFSYDGCFYGKGDWDWSAFKDLVFSETK